MDWMEWLNTAEVACINALREDAAGALDAELRGGRLVAERFRYGRTLLHIAAELGAVRCADVLLERGAELEALNDGGDSALLIAVGFGREKVARLLIAKGARVEFEWAPLDSAERQEALRANYRKMMEAAQAEFQSQLPAGLMGDMPDLSEEMAEQMVEVSTRVRTMHALDHCRDFGMLKLLVGEVGCDPNRHDGAGEWPLKTFAGANDAVAVAYLLAKGAAPDFTSTGDTALHAAVASNSIECARLLLEAGANVNQQDCDGCVPMYCASSHEMLDLLLEFGADANIGDQCGLKPSHWVEEKSLKERLLKLEQRDAQEEAQFGAGEGELGDFILAQAQKHGGRLRKTAGLPGISRVWRFFEDEHGIVIELGPKAFPQVERFLREAFGEPTHRADGTTDGGVSGWYASREFGVRVSFGVNVIRTQVILLWRVGAGARAELAG